MRIPFSAALTAGVLLATIGVLAPPAHAASGVRVAGDKVEVTAQPGVANEFWIRKHDGAVTVVDGGDEVTPGPGCVAEAANRVKCTSTGSGPGLRYVSVDAGDLNDVVDIRTTQLLRTFIQAGPGSDVVLGGSGSDRIDGGDGNDNLNGYQHIDFVRGGSGIDSLNGGDDNDYLDGGPGADDLIGGGGFDRAQYQDRTVGVSVSLDGIADDGEPHEGDNARADMEGVRGGSGDDRLIGNAARNELQAYEGHDVLVGGPGSDWLYAWQGNDLLDGGEGDDFLRGYYGRDKYIGGSGVDEVTYEGEFWPGSGVSGVDIDADGVGDDGWPWETENVPSDVENLTGTEGDDTIVGGNENNVLDGGSGNDILLGAGGDDILDCGRGTVDIAHGGPDTDQAIECETTTGIP